VKENVINPTLSRDLTVLSSKLKGVSREAVVMVED